MKPIKKPKFKMKLSNDPSKTPGVTTISLVNQPGIEINWIALSKDGKVNIDSIPIDIKLSIQDQQKQQLIGLALVPGLEIDRGLFSFEVDKEDIEAIVLKFFSEQRNGNVDLEHDGMLIDGAILNMSYNVERSLGIMPPNAYSNAPDGAWVIGMKVIDSALWDKVLDGTFNGFSIAGKFQMVPFEMSDVVEETEELDELDLYNRLQGILSTFSES
jgi:hypothetical protein